MNAVDQSPSRPLAASADDALRLGRGILILAFVLSFVVNLLRLSGPLFMILVYDRVLPARSQETLVALFAMVVVFLLAQGMIDYARRRILARFGAQFQERMEVRLFTETRHRDLFETGRSKPLAGLEEVDGLRAFFHSTSLIAIYDFFWAPMFVAVIFVLDPLLGGVCLAGMVVILCLMLVRMAFLGNREIEATAAGRAIGDLRTMLATSRQTLRNQNMSRGFSARWLATRATSRDRAIALKDWTVWFDSFCDVTVLLTRYSVLAVGAWLTLRGGITVGAMVAATFLVTRVLNPVEKFLTVLPHIAEARRHWGRLKKLLAGYGAEQADPFVNQGGNSRARLSLVNLSYRAPVSGATVLRSISCDIAPGQMIQINGMTGCGKTVLAETIIGLLRQSSGMILLDGTPLARLTDAQTDHLFGYVPESPSFISGTLAENIASLDPEASPALIAAAARKACLHAMISALPEGYQTWIDTDGSGFSRGQRHQLALARAVYRMPSVLIIDEPDPMMIELIPKTIEKTLQQLLDKGAAILILARKPLNMAQITAGYQIEDGRLKPHKSGPVKAAPIAKIAVLNDKLPNERRAPDTALAKRIGT